MRYYAYQANAATKYSQYACDYPFKNQTNIEQQHMTRSAEDEERQIVAHLETNATKQPAKRKMAPMPRVSQQQRKCKRALHEVVPALTPEVVAEVALSKTGDMTNLNLVEDAVAVITTAIQTIVTIANHLLTN